MLKPRNGLLGGCRRASFSAGQEMGFTMRTPAAFVGILAMGLFAPTASADPVERGYQAQSNAVKGKVVAGGALFGQSIDDAPGHKIFGEVASVGRGCNPDDYPAEVAGKVVLVERGGCLFTEKVAKAQAAGAVAVVVYNNAAGGDAVIAMAGPADFNDTIGIPSAFVGRTFGRAMAESRKPVTVQVKDKTRDKLDTRED
jgi:hypothetical protein